MKLLFVCYAYDRGGVLKCASWIKSIVDSIDDEYEISIVTSRRTTSVTVESAGKKIVIDPFSLESAEQQDEALRSACADVIVIFGTECEYSRDALLAAERIGALDKTVIFAQGMSYACFKHYAEGVPERIIKRHTFRDLMRRKNIKAEIKEMEGKAETEKLMLGKTRNFIGRTTMDKAILKMFNPSAAYYKCNDVLRDSFYSGDWRYESCQKHRIFICQFYYPIKGFHYLLEAAALLKERYPNLCIAAAGYNPIATSLTKNELKDSSYIRYIKSLVRQYGLGDNVELLGELDEQQMKDEYLKSNVFVIPSTIENSPNSLAEAMMLGVPCVASNVGGIPDFASHGTEAYIYPSSASYMLAYYLDAVLGDPELAAKIGAEGKKRALREYDKNVNIRNFENVMTKIAQK